MNFHFITARGVPLHGELTIVDDLFYVMYHDGNHEFEEILVFVFREVVGHPALVREFVVLPHSDASKPALLEYPIEMAVPKRILSSDLAEIQRVSAAQVIMAIELTHTQPVMEVGDKFKQAMDMIHKLKIIAERQIDSGFNSQQAVEFKVQLEVAASKLQMAPNSRHADLLAEATIASLGELADRATSVKVDDSKSLKN